MRDGSTMRALVLEEYNAPFRMVEMARPDASGGTGAGADQGEWRESSGYEDPNGEWSACEAAVACCAWHGYGWSRGKRWGSG